MNTFLIFVIVAAVHNANIANILKNKETEDYDNYYEEDCYNDYEKDNDDYYYSSDGECHYIENDN